MGQSLSGEVLAVTVFHYTLCTQHLPSACSWQIDTFLIVFIIIIFIVIATGIITLNQFDLWACGVRSDTNKYLVIFIYNM
jgi:hypothetical protein